ncbi:YlmH family RNA-binding protein [Schinkia azotoformans]|uniref:YlmH family RNA-binding protein n=1 Tax=Schinkia azotoformans TaxID=1454 RepID=UPI002DB600FA|nr:RNA-binding protein [Schinkia azotoformans]MEC1715376.1 RNA-binding protein [Schinkia azotoformans]MEC1740874.1 RNA-binding protein [Schinkia azotoformans]MEC1746624.1 RNA-binding protein [Schinkia azotoformans]MEC1757748.1 RNA-binding protein [Schinkia azotoformans]MEC1767831.1 RNA-binding protein [Schinkia azotoformans]
MSIYQHFRKEEHAFIDQIIEWREQVANEYTYKLLDFYDPREIDIVQSIIGSKEEVKCAFWGGYDQAERKRAILYPEYYEVQNDDFDIVAFSINFPSKFVTLDHRKVLGSTMGLGLKRSKFGDIIIDKEVVQIIIASQVAEYVRLHFNQVGKTNVTLEQIGCEKIIPTNEEWHEHTYTVSSMRLDVILAEVFNLSRTKVLPYIQNQMVKVNWKVTDDPSFLCHQGDTLSMRMFGRCKIKRIEGQTKKEKWRIVVAKAK